MKRDGVLMRRTKLHIMCGKKLLKAFMLGGISCMLFWNIIGCSPTTRGEYLAKQNKSDQEHAAELFEAVTDALETEDTEAIKKLFSPYALENSEDLEEKIQALMEFYPGSNGGYKVVVPTHESTQQYGVKKYVICPKYTITNDDEVYQMRLTVYVQNDEEPDKEGVYMIQVMTEDAWPEDFKWKDEEDAPGVYVLE